VLGIIVWANLPAASAFAALKNQMADERADLTLFYDKEELVEVATRAPKPLSQVAENVSIITAEEIDALHAHSVGAVLKYVAGIYIASEQEPFGSEVAFIHGSHYENTLILLDGIRWGYVFADFPDLIGIPIHAVKRIEIIKGPASSTWGSSLGGVINIITKDPGADRLPRGKVFASYGKSRTGAASAEIAGGFGKAGYYLQAGVHNSDGITFERQAEGKSFFGKVGFEPHRRLRFTFSAGYTDPEFVYIKRYAADWDQTGKDKASFYTVSMDTIFSEQLSATLSFYRYEHEYKDFESAISTGLKTTENIYDSATNGAAGRLVWSNALHAVVLGAEIQNAQVDSSIEYVGWNIYGPTDNEEKNRAVYLNDTIRWKDFTFTPGIRFDSLDFSDNIWSPGFGLTYTFAHHTILRATLSKGFRKPPISHKQYNVVDEVYTDFFGSGISNPSLESEEARSVQVGLETVAFPYCRFKTTLFFHKVNNTWFHDADYIFRNGGTARHKGGEVEIKTVPFHNISLAANYTFTRIEPDTESPGNHQLANVRLIYKDARPFSAMLLGHYVGYGKTLEDSKTGSSEAMIWDLHLSKTFHGRGDLEYELFVVGHNLFDGRQSEYADPTKHPNAERWFEGGVKVVF